MPWVIERAGTYHSDSGWKVQPDAAKKFESAEDAEDMRKTLQDTTLAGLPGEVHVREIP